MNSPHTPLKKEKRKERFSCHFFVIEKKHHRKSREQYFRDLDAKILNKILESK
jgi:hypothetical protein